MDGDNINVVIRVRPLNQKEIKVDIQPVHSTLEGKDKKRLIFADMSQNVRNILREAVRFQDMSQKYMLFPPSLGIRQTTVSPCSSCLGWR